MPSFLGLQPTTPLDLSEALFDGRRKPMFIDCPVLRLIYSSFDPTPRRLA